MSGFIGSEMKVAESFDRQIGTEVVDGPSKWLACAAATAVIRSRHTLRIVAALVKFIL